MDITTSFTFTINTDSIAEYCLDILISEISDSIEWEYLEEENKKKIFNAVIESMQKIFNE